MKKNLKKLLVSFLALSSFALVGCSEPLASNTSSGDQSSSISNEELYSVSIAETAFAHGEVTLSKTGDLPLGTEVEILVVPENGYAVESYFLNGELLASNTFSVKEGQNLVNVTYRALEPEIRYGTVRVVESDEFGTITPKLEDGTVLDASNSRLEVGTRVVLEVSPINETYIVDEIKLNDEVLTPTDNLYSFEVVEGKNFLSSSFTLARPGYGLVRLSGNYENGNVSIDKVDDYYPVGETVTVNVIANSGYIVREVALNGSALTSTEEGVYTFQVVEGLNSLNVEIVVFATGLTINVPEGATLDEDYTIYDRYLVVVGNSYQMEATLSPEGSYADIVWSVGSFDSSYLEITEDGLLTVLEPSSSSCSVTATLRDNSSIRASISLLPVTQTDYNMAGIKSSLALAREVEGENVNEVEFVSETKATSDVAIAETTYHFEAYADEHSVTEVTTPTNTTEYYYRGIVDNKYYTLKKDSFGASSIINSVSDVTDGNREEYLKEINTFGALELDETYNGVADYLYTTLFDGYNATFEDEELLSHATIVVGDNAYDLYSRYYEEDFLHDIYLHEYQLNVVFDVEGQLRSASYSHTQYEVSSIDEEPSSSTPYSVERMSAQLLSGERGEDHDNFFNLDDYFFSSFDVEIRDASQELIAPESDVYQLLNGDRYYLDLTNYLPDSSLIDIDIPSFSLDKEGIISLPEKATYGGTGYYFDAEMAGEVNLTIETAKAEPVTITINVSNKAIESISFTSRTPDSIYIGQETIIEATVEPSTGIATDEITYVFKEGSETHGARIEERPDRWGISTDFYLVSGNEAGTVTIVATSVADPTKSVEKEIEIKPVPDFSNEIAGNTFNYETSDFWGDYSYKFSFGALNEGVMDLSVEIKFSEEDWYTGEVTETTYLYEAKATINGLSIILTDVTSSNASDLSMLSETMTINMDENETFSSLSTTFDDSTINLTKGA